MSNINKENIPLSEEENIGTWPTRIKVLIFSGLFASLANYIYTWRAAGKAIKAGAEKIPAIVMPWEVFLGLALMFGVIIVGCLVDELFKKIKIKLPTIIYISLLSVILSIPNVSPIAATYNAELAKIGLLPLCTPILAYAGISLGKDWAEFRQQGVGIICTALMTFVGTYLGSAIIAQIGLSLAK